MIIKDEIGEAACLEILAEESAELAQAALKLARIDRGENPTPITREEALDHLSEEIADVFLAVRELRLHRHSDLQRRVDEKYTRWEQRIANAKS